MLAERERRGGAGCGLQCPSMLCGVHVIKDQSVLVNKVWIVHEEKEDWP